MKYFKIILFQVLHFSLIGQVIEERNSFINKARDVEFSFDASFLKFKSIDSIINLKPENNYKTTCTTIEVKRIQFAKMYAETTDSLKKQQILDNALIYFTQQLINHIIPYWYGTKWEFSGYTAIPGKGTVACGYFVSTTLLHMGLNLNRYKLAQAGPAAEAHYLSIKSHNTDSLFYPNSSDKGNVIDIYNRLSDGFYFIGLDFHVGFLLKKDHSLLFIHSNYVDGYVMAEHAYQSEAFHSKHYYFTKISSNYELAKAWILGTELIK